MAAILVSAGAEPSVENFDTSDEMIGETGVASDEEHLEEFAEDYDLVKSEGLSGKTPIDLACSERVRIQICHLFTYQ